MLVTSDTCKSFDDAKLICINDTVITQAVIGDNIATREALEQFILSIAVPRTNSISYLLYKHCLELTSSDWFTHASVSYLSDNKDAKPASMLINLFHIFGFIEIIREENKQELVLYTPSWIHGYMLSDAVVTRSGIYLKGTKEYQRLIRSKLLFI